MKGFNVNEQEKRIQLDHKGYNIVSCFIATKNGLGYIVFCNKDEQWLMVALDKYQTAIVIEHAEQ